jgi:hypothetical protein
VVNGKVRKKARTVNLLWNAAFASGGHYNEHCDLQHLPKGGALSPNCFGFVFNPQDIPQSWDISPEALKLRRVGAYHSFTMPYHTVNSTVRESSSIFFDQPSFFPYGGEESSSGRRWFIENAKEIRPGAGEWRFDVANVGQAHNATSPEPPQLAICTSPSLAKTSPHPPTPPAP